MRSTSRLLLASILTGCALSACGDPNYAEGLKPPPTAGTPTAGPGSGKAIAALLHYTYQRDNPTKKIDGVTCKDVPFDAKVGTVVPCTVKYADEDVPQPLQLRLTEENWKIESPK
jgi:hypothetical protein